MKLKFLLWNQSFITFRILCKKVKASDVCGKFLCSFALLLTSIKFTKVVEIANLMLLICMLNLKSCNIFVLCDNLIFMLCWGCMDST